MKYIYLFLIFAIGIISSSCNNSLEHNNTIMTIPIYGQSLALGEEAKLVTNFDSLKLNYNHRILTENLDESFGFFSNSIFKQNIKRLVNDNRRTFEITAYGMAESIVSDWVKTKKNNLLLCTFPEGTGATGIDGLGKNSDAYNKLLKELKTAYDKAKGNKCTLIVPAICWLQGENDLVWGIKNYKNKLLKFRQDLNQDIKSITKQKSDIYIILYQTNCLTISKDSFNMNKFDCQQAEVPQAQIELIRDNNYFIASGPTYPYSIVREYVHLDGISQKRLGYLQGISLQKFLSGKKHQGLIPKEITRSCDTLTITFYIPTPPLVLDTISVAKIDNYGFSVISPMNENILKKVELKENKIRLICKKTPKNVKIRYAINGTHLKSGNKQGPRGNLRDSQGNYYTCKISNQKYRLDNWCYMFDNLANFNK